MSIIAVHGPNTWGSAGGPSPPGKVYTGSMYSSVTASDAANAAKLIPLGIFPVPTTAWTTGQSITVNTFAFNWTGSAWAPGVHALMASEQSAPTNGEEWDPADYTVAEVIAYADENPSEAAEILAAEQAGKNRTTLVSHLEGLIE